MNELLPYVKEELGPIVQTPPIPCWEDHIEKFLKLTNIYECQSSENFEQSKEWAAMGVRLKDEMFASFIPYFDFLDKLRKPIIERRNHYINKVNERMNLIDSSAIDWKREQDRILEAEQEKKRAEELQRRIEEREKLLRDFELKKQIAMDFAGSIESVDIIVEEAIKTIADLPPVVEPRHSAVKSEFTYRKGKRNKPKLIAKIVNPEQVKREFCQPDKTLINLKVANWAKQVIKPSDEQIVALAAEIGGVVLGFEG